MSLSNLIIDARLKSTMLSLKNEELIKLKELSPSWNALLFQCAVIIIWTRHLSNNYHMRNNQKCVQYLQYVQ